MATVVDVRQKTIDSIEYVIYSVVVGSISVYGSVEKPDKAKIKELERKAKKPPKANPPPF